MKPCSIQPVLDAKAGNAVEIADVSRQQRGVMGKADRRDFQVHRAGAPMKRQKAAENVCCFAVKGEDRQFTQGFDAGLKARIRIELVRTGLVPSNKGNPALKRFLGGNDAGKYVGLMGFDSRGEPLRGGGGFSKFTEVIRVQDDEHASVAGGLTSAPFLAKSVRFLIGGVALGRSHNLSPVRLGHGNDFLLQPFYARRQFGQFLLDRFRAHGATVPAGVFVRKCAGRRAS